MPGSGRLLDQQLLMGSVSSQVTHQAHCAVVVIPAGDL